MIFVFADCYLCRLNRNSKTASLWQRSSKASSTMYARMVSKTDEKTARRSTSKGS